MSKNKINKLKKFIYKNQDDLKILIIRNGLIGDMVFITPVIERLNNEFPNANVDLVVGYKTKDLFTNHRGIKNLFLLPKEFKISEHLKFFYSLRKHKYDIVFVQEVNTHYSLMSKIINSKFVLGYENSLSWLHDISVKRTGHAVDAEQQLLNIFLDSEKIQTALYTNEKNDSVIQELLSAHNISKNEKFICIQVTCSEKNSVRQISNKKLAQLTDKLINKHNFKVVFIGVAEDNEEIHEVQKFMENKSINFAGKTTLQNLISLLKISQLVIGPDTGTLHMANAVNTPVLMYIGYADPSDTGPYDLSGKSCITQSNLDCIPCKHSNPKPIQWESCKTLRPTACMDAITVEQLLSDAEQILSHNGAKDSVIQ